MNKKDLYNSIKFICTTFIVVIVCITIIVLALLDYKFIKTTNEKSTIEPSSETNSKTLELSEILSKYYLSNN